MFANGPENLGSIPGQVIPKTQKMVLNAFLLSTQHYKVRIKGKLEQSRERSSALSYTLMLQLSEKKPLGHSQLGSPALLLFSEEICIVYLALGFEFIKKLSQSLTTNAVKNDVAVNNFILVNFLSCKHYG